MFGSWETPRIPHPLPRPSYIQGIHTSSTGGIQASTRCFPPKLLRNYFVKILYSEAYDLISKHISSDIFGGIKSSYAFLNIFPFLRFDPPLIKRRHSSRDIFFIFCITMLWETTVRAGASLFPPSLPWLNEWSLRPPMTADCLMGRKRKGKYKKMRENVRKGTYAMKYEILQPWRVQLARKYMSVVEPGLGSHTTCPLFSPSNRYMGPAAFLLRVARTYMGGCKRL